MQGLYKKVLRGVYPKIPVQYSTELATVVKAMIQVSPNMRPTCDRILDMPVVKKRTQMLFPEDQVEDTHSLLLSTIRVPKNLLYLTDRLPKPAYRKEEEERQRLEEEQLRRKTHDAGQMLPDINNSGQKRKMVYRVKNKPGVSKLRAESETHNSPESDKVSIVSPSELSHVSPAPSYDTSKRKS